MNFRSRDGLFLIITLSGLTDDERWTKDNLRMQDRFW